MFDDMPFGDLPTPEPEQLEENLNELLMSFEEKFQEIYGTALKIEDPAKRYGAIGLGLLVTLKSNPMFLVEFASSAIYKLIQLEEEKGSRVN